MVGDTRSEVKRPAGVLVSGEVWSGSAIVAGLKEEIGDW